ncbi:hypothetical protein [Paraburkholderia diazotrophica]|uniref:hypothetical protein n=1 Tax=Paraburkholderia diazotrophica TaxID=667676 RepID=UPI003175BAAC
MVYLGSVYVSASFGDIYSFINPFALMLRIAARCFPSIEKIRFRYPRCLASYPALLTYIVLISLELFGSGRPRDASLFLIGYSIYAFASSLCFGREVWLNHFDAFGILRRLCAKLSPYKWSQLPGKGVRVRLRNPIDEMASEQPLDASMISFLSFMLSSTAYDALGALGAQSPMNGRVFAQQFSLLLLPIALFYNVCHYFTLCLAQGRQILSLASDPLGVGWHLLSILPDEYTATSQLIARAHNRIVHQRSMDSLTSSRIEIMERGFSADGGILQRLRNATEK